MSEQDDFTRFVECLGAMAKLYGLMCRRMHRASCEFDGEVFPAYWEYEARHRQDSGMRLWTFPDGLGQQFMTADENGKKAVGEVVWMEIKAS